MPHTLELSMKLSSWEHYNLVVRQMYDYAKKHGQSCCYPLSKPRKGSIIGTEFTAFTNMGIMMYVMIYNTPTYSSYVWDITINPASRYGVDRISVSSQYEVMEIFGILDYSLRHELEIPCNHNDFNTNRLDCAKNHFFEDAEMAELYMSLQKKADIPREFEVYSEYNSKMHRNTEPEGSIYCWNRSRTVTVNIYIKAIQLQNDRYISSEYDLTPATRLLRTEVQCSRQKLSSYKKLLGVNNLSPEPFITDSFNFYILGYYLKQFFRIGDYYTFATAKEAIESSAVHDSSKALMMLMLELTSRRNGLKLAINEMLAMGYDADDIGATLKRFDNLKINPVTIPVKYGVPFLPSPANLLSQ